AQIHRDLFVARPSGVKTPTGVAELFDEHALDEAVDILVRAVDELWLEPSALEDRRQRLLDLRRVVVRQHAGLRNGARPREAAGHVVLKETAVEPKGRAELEGGRVGCRVEPSGPQMDRH